MNRLYLIRIIQVIVTLLPVVFLMGCSDRDEYSIVSYNPDLYLLHHSNIYFFVEKKEVLAVSGFLSHGTTREILKKEYYLAEVPISEKFRNNFRVQFINEIAIHGDINHYYPAYSLVDSVAAKKVGDIYAKHCPNSKLNMLNDVAILDEKVLFVCSNKLKIVMGNANHLLCEMDISFLQNGVNNKSFFGTEMEFSELYQSFITSDDLVFLVPKYIGARDKLHLFNRYDQYYEWADCKMKPMLKSLNIGSDVLISQIKRDKGGTYFLVDGSKSEDVSWNYKIISEDKEFIEDISGIDVRSSIWIPSQKLFLIDGGKDIGDLSFKYYRY